MKLGLPPLTYFIEVYSIFSKVASKIFTDLWSQHYQSNFLKSALAISSLSKFLRKWETHGLCAMAFSACFWTVASGKIVVSWKTPVRTCPSIQHDTAEQTRVQKPGRWRIWLKCPLWRAGDPAKGSWASSALQERRFLTPVRLSGGRWCS